MSALETAEQVWTEEEVRGFWQAVGAFRDGLPSGQREALNAILAGASRAAEGGAGENEKAAAFGQRLATFRQELSPREREAFSSIVAAGIAQLGTDGDDVQGYQDPSALSLGEADEVKGYLDPLSLFIGGLVVTGGVLVGNDQTREALGGAVMSPQQIEAQMKKKGKTPT